MLGQTNGGNAGRNGYTGNGGKAGGIHRITSLIGLGVAYKGTLSGEAGVRIDGTFDGRINIGGPLVISDSGKVTSEEIRAAVVSVAGSVRGNIVARQVEILAGGRVWGDVTAVEFASEEGAVLRGQVKMLDDLPQ